MDENGSVQGSNLKSPNWQAATKSSSVHRFTPVIVLELVRELFEDEIGLDPCPHPDAKVAAKVEFLLPERDGLLEKWRGYGGIFCNWPYSRLLTPKWCNKIGEEFPNGGDGKDELVALMPTRPGARWFRDLHKPFIDALFFWGGRMAFAGPGLAEDSAPFESMLTYIGHRPQRFLDVLSDGGKNGWGIVLPRKK